MYRGAGGDISDSREKFAMTDVASAFDVFNAMTWELSKVNLKELAGKGLGTRMGAVVWSYDAGAGRDGPPVKEVDKNKEVVLYDSQTAKRTLIGRLYQLPCCYPPVYKLTSERMLYAEWDFWYLGPCDMLSLPFVCVKAACLDVCGCARDPVDVAESRAAMREAGRNATCACCFVPVGRTANYFDIDIVVDVGAHQKCTELCLNEGSLVLYRLAGGDASARDQQKFIVYAVPEVFSGFDDMSFELARGPHPLQAVRNGPADARSCVTMQAGSVAVVQSE